MIAIVLALLAAPAACPHPHRSQAPIEQFKKATPCPEKCETYVKIRGKFKLYRKCGRCQVDHVCPLACCGEDAVENLQWLTNEENRTKSADCSSCQRAGIDWYEIDRAAREAARRADERLAPQLEERRRALAKLQAELDAILKRNREAFERGER